MSQKPYEEQGKKRARPRRSKFKIAPIAGTLAAIVLAVILWPSLSQWMSSGSPNQQTGPAAEMHNPFAAAQNAGPQIKNQNAVDTPDANGRKEDAGDDQAPKSKATVAATAGGIAPAPPGMAPAPPGMAPAPPGVTRPPSDAADHWNEADDTLAAERVAKLAGLIDIVEPCLVRLEVVSTNGKTWGSGFLVDEGGTIVTNYHIIEDALSITALFSNNSKLEIAGFKQAAPAKDLAVLQTATPERKLPFLQLAKKDPVKKDNVVAFGSPNGMTFSASEGIVNGVRAGKKAGELAELGADLTGAWAQITATVSPDNSGGPLVNRAGEIVGINTMTLAAEQNQNFAVARDELRLVLGAARDKPVTPFEKLPPSKSGRKAARPAIDADAASADDGQSSKSDLSDAETTKFKSLSTLVWFGAKYRDIKALDAVVKKRLGRTPKDAGSGVAIDEVSDDSPAARAGIQKDDLIGTIDKKPVFQASDVEELVDQFKAGQEVKVSLLRPQTGGKYTNKLVNVRIVALVSSRAIDHAASADVPVEVRDFLKRHLLRYRESLFEANNSADRQKSGPAPAGGGKQSPAATGGVSVKALLQKGPFAPLFYPAFGTDVPVHMGSIGNLERVRVLAVATQKMAVARVKGGLIALLADTSSLIKGKPVKEDQVNLGRAQIIGIVTVLLDEAKEGRTATVFAARPLAVEEYYPQEKATADDDR
jgi:S1-C subfamily serine protease